MAKKLTAKQAAFVREYLVDLNAAAAARRAGYSARTADRIGHENLRKPEIAAAIEAAMKERAERTKVTGDMVVEELAKIGFSDMRRIASWSEAGGVSLLPSEALDERDSACVSQVQSTRTVTTDRYGNVTETENTTVKLHGKLGALNALGKHFGIFEKGTDDVGRLAETFLAGAEAMRKLEVRDLSEG